MREPKNRCVVGDRVTDANTGSKGIVIDINLRLPSVAGKCIERAKVHWTDCSSSLIGDLQDGWMCEGNLIIDYDKINLFEDAR